ncbi:GldG family protein [Sphingomonas sp. BN140010]|uniref:GldG family protein n=1 Tax=Sphingomonas arvum TaxID=2992113 RepID=A0ABT3JGV7_9SPHN|nr:GldG family protein [Sphingomonas sp. BN140010]MCW3798323.1 GldG family protein [Sphingomonas sp. BN140010]
MAALAALLLLSCQRQEHRQTRHGEAVPQPQLALLTGLPLVFGEGFSLEAAKHPVIARLERDYQVRLVDGPEQLGTARLLLAAQPRALTAGRLVALDEWVRAGGRLVLLADPLLSWPTDLPLGDPQRPPYEYADTGLLAHWGLRLERPDSSRAAMLTLAGQAVATPSPGTLNGTGGKCRISPDRHSAACGLGKGRAVVVADADFLRSAAGPEALAEQLEQLKR